MLKLDFGLRASEPGSSLTESDGMMPPAVADKEKSAESMGSWGLAPGSMCLSQNCHFRQQAIEMGNSAVADKVMIVDYDKVNWDWCLGSLNC